MSVPQTQAQLLQAINKNYAKLAGYLTHIPPEMTEQKTLPGHAQNTEMSVRDLVCYLLGWNELVLKWLAHDEAQQPSTSRKPVFNGTSLGCWRKSSTSITPRRTTRLCSILCIRLNGGLSPASKPRTMIRFTVGRGMGNGLWGG